MLTWNPSWRSSAQEALRHSFFRMGKPSSNSQNNSDTPSSINSISSKMQGLATCEILETTPKLSLNLRPKALLQSEQHDQSSFQVTKDNGPSQYSTYADNLHTISNNNKDVSPSHHNDVSRIPLPITEIEPHYSRDSYISPKGKKKSVTKGHASNKNKERENLGKLVFCAFSCHLYAFKRFITFNCYLKVVYI